jgi:hypothetical protein
MRFLGAFLITLISFAVCPAAAQQISHGGVVMTHPPINNQSIVDLAHAGFSDKFVLEWIRKSRTSFDISAEGLVKLRTAGLGEDVINLMIAMTKTFGRSN